MNRLNYIKPGLVLSTLMAQCYHHTPDCANNNLPASSNNGNINMSQSSRVFGIPVNDSMVKMSRENGQQVMIQFDYKTRNPKFVYERLIKESIDKAAVKQNRKEVAFYADDNITAEHFKVRHGDYINSNFDRGHMIPAADMNFSQDLYHFTFSMANICPQNPDLNKVYWNRFELWIRYIFQKDQYEDMEVITGPVYAPVNIGGKWVYSNQTVGNFPRLITVPTHFFKVIKANKYVPYGKGNEKLQQVVIGAFLIPNKPIKPDIPIENFAINLDQLEQIVGLRIFESLTAVERNNIEKLFPCNRDLNKLLAFNYNENEVINVNRSTQKKFSPSIHLCQESNCNKAFK